MIYMCTEREIAGRALARDRGEIWKATYLPAHSKGATGAQHPRRESSCAAPVKLGQCCLVVPVLAAAREGCSTLGKPFSASQW